MSSLPQTAACRISCIQFTMTCAGLGPIVFSACSHAGIVNVMKDLQSKAGRLHAVMGGKAHQPQAVKFVWR